MYPAWQPAALCFTEELHIAYSLHGRYPGGLAQGDGGGQHDAEHTGCGHRRHDRYIRAKDIAIPQQLSDPPDREAGRRQAKGDGAKSEQERLPAEDSADLLLRGPDGAKKADLPLALFQVGREGVDDPQAGGADQHQGDDREKDRGGHNRAVIGVIIAGEQPVACRFQIGPAEFGDQIVFQAEFS